MDSEVINAYEAGWRKMVNEKLSFDLALFYNKYDDLIVVETGGVSNNAVNAAEADSYGFEISSNYFVSADWQLTLSYSYYDIDVDYEENTQSIFSIEGVTADHQVSAYSHLEFNKSVSWDVNAYYQDSKYADIDTQGDSANSSYIKLDTKLNWQYSESLLMYIMGQNLLQDSQSETLYYSEVPRTVLFGLQYKF